MKKFDVGKHRIIIKKVHKSGYMSSGGRPKAKFNVDYAKKLHDSGYSYAEVAKLLGVSKSTAYKYINDLDA